MYVFVTVTELSSPSREQDLGELADTTSFAELKNFVLSRVESEIKPEARDAARHFWHNQRLCPNEGLLADVASGNDIVSLELSQDLYYVTMPKTPRTTYAIDPEALTVSEVIHSFMEELSQGRHGAECCYELCGHGGAQLDPSRTLLEQGALPNQAELVLRRKRIVHVWGAALLGVAVVLGLLLGFLSGNLMGQ